MEITGIQNVGDRTLVYFDIDYNDQIYKWWDYCTGSMAEIYQYIQDKLPAYKTYIDAREALWLITPKTKEVEGLIGSEPMIIEVLKEEIVCPPPDYATLRRNEYPMLAEYVDGVVKEDQAQIDKYIADCLAVKEKYPKPYV